jgi:hypothetical protein
MGRRVIREDLTGSSPLREGRRSYEFVWYRWESGYRLVERDGKEPYFEAVPADFDDLDWYYPLISTPHLFLDFARLQEQKDVDGAIRAWIDDHGLLGLHTCEPSAFREDVPSMMYFVGEHSTEGGPGETLLKVRTEVEIANRVLTLYEATLSKDTAKLEQAFKADGDSAEARRRRSRLRSLARGRSISYVDCLVHYTLERVFSDVQQVLETFTYPCLVHHSPSTRPPVEHVWTLDTMKSSLWPRNLLGAMYLQFLWLVDSAGDLSRCKHCDRIISYAPPRPGSAERKPRKDKEFCDSRCRQNYHYHHRVKAERPSTRA